MPNKQDTRKRQSDWAKVKRSRTEPPTVQEIKSAIEANRQSIIDRLFLRCYATRKGCWFWIGAFRGKYGKIEIVVPGKRPVQISTHRLSAFLFGVLDLDSQLDALHKCDNPPCFNPDHLFSGTDSDNQWDCSAKGRKNPPRGEDNHWSVLSVEEVKRIKSRLNCGETVVSVAKDYPHVSVWAIYPIKSGENWGSVI